MTGHSDNWAVLAAGLLVCGCGDAGQVLSSCTVEDNHDGTATISCPDGTDVTVQDQGCTVTENGDGTKTIACTDGTSVTVAAVGGPVSCSVRQDCRGMATVSCPDGTSATWYTGVFCPLATAGSTCGIRRSGELRCWGGYFREQDGGVLPPAGRFVQVDGALGAGVLFGLRYDGVPVFLGPAASCDQAPGLCEPPDDVFVQVSAGYNFGCGINVAGVAKCWGQNDFGEAEPPDHVFLQVSCSGGFACGVTAGRQIVCWGEGDTVVPPPPPPGEYLSVSVSGLHGCALTPDASVACWGDNRYGQAAPPEGEFIEVSVGVWHSCGVKSDGSIVCWGGGTNSEGCQTLIDCGQSVAPEGRFLSVGAGPHETCAVRVDGTAVCWGYNLNGQTDVPEDFPF